MILDRKYRDAADALAKDEGTADQAAGRRFLRGHALVLAGDGPGAVAVFESYIKDFPKGPEAARARDGIAAAKRIQKDFAGAAAIEREMLQKMLAPARRMELAKIYLDYAEKAEKTTTPDWARARVFYDLAATLELPKDDDTRVRLKGAEMSEKLNEFPDALNRVRAIQKVAGDGPNGEIQFKVATLQRQTGDLRGARRAMRNFIKDHPAAEKAPDALNEIALTFGMPNPVDDDSLAQGVAAYQELITKYPKADLTRNAAFQIAVAELARSRLDEAARDFGAFVSSAQKDDKDQRIAVARARIGAILYQQGKFNEAIGAWKLYLTEHPTHGEFATVNRAIVDAEYSIAMKAVADAFESTQAAKDKGDAARAAILTFLAGHPLDERHAKTAMYLAVVEEKRERFDVAREEFERVASRYANTNESSEAMFNVGRIYEEKTFDYDKAIETYKKVVGPWQDMARQRIAALQEKQLIVKTKRTWRSDEEPSIDVTTRNIQKLRLRAFKLDLEVFFRSKLATPKIDALDVEVIEPDVRREVSASPYVAHKQTTQAVALGEFKGKPGAYVVKVDDGEFEASTLVLVSDLVFITKGMPRGVLVFAQNAITGEPVRDARMVVSDGKKILLEDKTGADGVLYKMAAWEGNVDKLVVYGSSEMGAAVSGMDVGSITKTQALSERTLVITDRSSYRPGDAVRAWSIVRGVKDNQYTIQDGRDIKISLADPAGVVVRSVDANLTAFGTALANLELPTNANYGSWTVTAYDVANKTVLGTRAVEIEEVRRDRIKLEVTIEKPVLMRGDTVKGSVKARYFSGGPAAKRQLNISLDVNDPLTLMTDETGTVNFTFETRELADEGTYSVVARMDDEGAFGVGDLTVATVGFRPSIKAAQAVVLVNEPIDLAIEARDAAKKPYAAELQIKVLRNEPKGRREVHTTNVTTDIKTGNAASRVTVAEGGVYTIRVEGKDAFGSIVAAETTVTVSGDDDAQKLRIFVDRERWKLGETMKVRVISRLSKERSALVTFDGDGVLSYKIAKVARGESFLEFTMDEKLAPQATLSLAAVDDWKLYHAGRRISIAKGLSIEVKPPKDPVAPGAEAKIEFTVHDARGNPVSAEVLISAVDAAFLAKRPDTNVKLLDYFYPALRDAGTAMTSSCGFAYDAQTRRVSGDLAAEELRVREELERRANSHSTPGGPSSTAYALNEDLKSVDLLTVAGGGAGGGRVADRSGKKRPGAANTPSAAPAEKSDELKKLGYAPSDDAQIDSLELEAAAEDMGVLAGASGGQPAKSPARGRSQRTFGGKNSANKDKSSLSSLRRAAGSAGKIPQGDFVSYAGNSSLADDESWRSDFDDHNETAAEPVVRTDFSENACFTIGTSDATGAGFITLKTPGSTTEWSVAARAATKITELGEGAGTFQTHKDLETSLRLPSAVVEGDRMDSAILVRNATDKKLSVDAEITVTGGEGSGSAHLDLNAGEEGTASRPIVIGTANTTKITVRAKADHADDAMENVINVHPAGSLYIDSASGIVRDKSIINLGLKDFGKLRNPRLEIHLSPGMDADILEDAHSHVKYYSSPDAFQDSPGWSVTRGENALFRLIYIGRAGLADEALLAKTRQRVRDAVARVSMDLGADGTLSWAGNSNRLTDKMIQPIRPDAATTARGLAFLARAKRAGFEVSDAVLGRLINWARENSHKLESTTDRARVLYALAEADSADVESNQRLQRSRAELTDTGLALLALADSRMARRDLASEVIDTLKRRIQNTNDALPFGAGKIAAVDALEATGLAIAAIAEVEPSEPHLKNAVDALRTSRKHFATDRGEAAAVRGLVANFMNVKVENAAYTLKIELNNGELKSLKSADLKGELTIEVPADKILEKNQIRATLEGRGEVALFATISAVGNGFRKPDQQHAYLSREIQPALLTFKGKTIQRGYSVVEDSRYKPVQYDVKNLTVGTEATVMLGFGIREPENAKWDYVVMEEPIPAGCELVPNSIQGNFERAVLRNGSIFAAFASNSTNGWLHYKIIASRSGSYTFAPAVMRSSYRPELFGETDARSLNILPIGTPSPDVFNRTADELYFEGMERFDAGQHAEGAVLLRKLCVDYHLRPEFLREASRSILTEALERKDSIEAINAFERIRDRFADVVFPFETIAQVGDAYVNAQQAEMADLVFRGTLGALYRRDANVAGALLRENEFFAAVRFLMELHSIYADLPDSLISIHELAGLVTATAANMPKTLKGVSKEQLLTIATGLEVEYMVRGPESSLAPEAAFGYLSALLSLEQFKQVIDSCSAFERRYPTSEWLDKVLYLEGYARFASGESAAALDVLKRVITENFIGSGGGRGPSSYRDRATLLRAQILHATGDIKGAVQEYEKVRAAFTDASDAVQNFRQRSLTLPPVKVLAMADAAEFLAHSKNIAKVNMRVYRVDLMRLYLMERNLDRMTNIDLSGIAPLTVKDVELGTAEDFTEKDTNISLDLKDKGAYLIVMRSAGDSGSESLAAATLLLRTDLKLEVREDVDAGRIWINVRDSKNASVAKADVRVVGSRDGSVNLGVTDLRGVYIADGVHGRATVVAQVQPTAGADKTGPSFAFFRGQADLVPPKPQADAKPSQQGQFKGGNFNEDAVRELQQLNFENNSRNAVQLENKLKVQQQGVEVNRVK